MSQLNHQISLLELIQIFEEYRQNIIINIKHLQENYQRTSIKRVKGVKDINGDLINPWLKTENVYPSDYVGIGVFTINRNTATINMLLKRKVKLVKPEDNTPMIEIAGLLANDLDAYNNYTIVKDGKIHIKSLLIKISSKKVFDLLKAKGVINADQFDFHTEYPIALDTLPLVPIDFPVVKINGVFQQLVEVKVLLSIVSACLRNESDVFITSQLDELRKHYLSKNCYLNFPTHNEYDDIVEAVTKGIIESHTSYKIDIGSHDILSLNKLYSANKFLARRYEAYHCTTGEIFLNPRFDTAFHENIAFRPKGISRRMKLTKVDDLMKPIFDDFLGIATNGKVTAILEIVGADSLVWSLSAKQAGKVVSKEEMISALTEAAIVLSEYEEKIYRERISPLVFYIGATGLLPDSLAAHPMNAEELAAKYPNLQFSKSEQAGTFFEVGDSVLGVYPQTEYYSKKSFISC